MPKKTIILDASQISIYTTCPKKWDYITNQGLDLIMKNTYALDKGSYVHLILETFYSMRALNPAGDRSRQMKFALDACEVAANEYKIEKKDRDIIFERCVQYVLFYATNDYQPFVVDDEPSVEIGFSYTLKETEDLLYILEGRIDLLARLKSFPGLIFVDHKSQSMFKTNYQYSTQFLCYALATGAKYAMYNYFGLQKEFKENRTLHRSHLINFPPELLEDFKGWLVSIYDRVAAGDVHKNWSECRGSFGPCEFTQLCTCFNAEIRDTLKKNAYTKKERWTPW